MTFCLKGNSRRHAREIARGILKEINDGSVCQFGRPVVDISPFSPLSNMYMKMMYGNAASDSSHAHAHTIPNDKHLIDPMTF